MKGSVNIEQALLIEGPDGSGKNYLALKVVEAIVRMGKDVMMTNYPSYIFFGSVVRAMNLVRPNQDHPLNELFSQINAYEQARHRAAMYALDRALSMIGIISAKKKYPDVILISDRSHFSNAVTAAYIWVNNPHLTEYQLQEFINNEIGDMDIEFRNLMNNPTVILCLAKLGENDVQQGIEHRGHLDILEEKPTQIRAREIYLQILPNHTLYTKESGVWRNSSQTVNEVLTRFPIGKGETSKPGEIHLIGPYEMAEALFTNVAEEIIKLDGEWAKASLDPEDSDGQRKIRLNELETRISKVFAKYLAYPDLLKNNYPEIVVTAIRRLVKDYPYLIDIIDAIEGQDSIYKDLILRILHQPIET